MKVLEDCLTVDDYRRLRKTCGLSEKSQEAAEIGLPNTLFSVTLEENEEVIGMGRIIGDGGTFVQVVDICVHPNYQGKGLGKTIMHELMKYIQKLPNSCYVSLMADGDASHLYEHFGFEEVYPKSKGMALKL